MRLSSSGSATLTGFSPARIAVSRMYEDGAMPASSARRSTSRLCASVIRTLIWTVFARRMAFRSLVIKVILRSMRTEPGTIRSTLNCPQTP